MNLLKWILEDGAASGIAKRPVDSDAGRNAITPEWHSQWRPDACGIHETRRHVGRSSSGFHPGIEVCHRIGMGRIEWGGAHPTPEKARLACGQLEIAKRSQIPACLHVCSVAMVLGCCLYSKVHSGIEKALLDLREIVAMIENDPAQNWPRLHPDFERAVAGLQQSITALWVRQGHVSEHGGGR